MCLPTKVKNQWLRMRHGHEISDHAADCAGFHRATTSFHSQDLPWRFSGKLHIQGPQRASSCISSDSRLPLPALLLSQLEFLTTLLHRALGSGQDLFSLHKGVGSSSKGLAGGLSSMHRCLLARSRARGAILPCRSTVLASSFHSQLSGGQPNQGAQHPWEQPTTETPPALWAVPVSGLQVLPVPSGQMTKCGRCLWLPSHRTVPSFGCKDIQLLITGRRGAEGDVEHSQGLFYRKAWTMMPGVTKAGRNPYREAGTCDKCHGTPPTEENSSGGTWAGCVFPAPCSTELMGNHNRIPSFQVVQLPRAQLVLQRLLFLLHVTLNRQLSSRSPEATLHPHQAQPRAAADPPQLLNPTRASPRM